jgi:hypothetical protein
VDSEPLARPVWGRSGLTDAERSLLAYVTLRHVAAELACSDQAAADFLDSYAERGDPARIVGDRHAVSMVVDGRELVRVDRAWLRAVAHRGAPSLN